MWNADTGEEEKIYDKPFGFRAFTTSLIAAASDLPGSEVLGIMN